MLRLAGTVVRKFKEKSHDRNEIKKSSFYVIFDPDPAPFLFPVPHQPFTKGWLQN